MRLEHEVVIDRPVDEVFAYLSEPGNLPEWQSGIVEVRKEADAPTAVGSRWIEVRTFLGRRIESTLEATAYDPSREFSLRVVSGPVRLRIRHYLEPSNGATRIRIVGEGEPGASLKLAGPLVARAAKRQFAGDFASLKRVLEARQST